MKHDSHVILVVRCVEAGDIEEASSHAIAIVLGVERGPPIVRDQVLLPIDDTFYVSFFYGGGVSGEEC